MAETKLGGEISLIGFDALEPMELIVIKKIVGNYVRKLSTQANYRSLKLELKQHRKGKSFTHEISAQALIGKTMLGASVTEWNLYLCLTKILDKVLSEAEHKKRSAKEVGEEMKRKQEQEKSKEQKAKQIGEQKTEII